MSRILRSSLVGAAGTMISRVAGAARDIAIANAFGAGLASDAFWIAFTIPNVFRRFVADEGLTGALIPAISQAEQNEGAEEARRLAGAAVLAVFLVALAIVGLGIATAPQLVMLFGAGFRDDPAQFNLAVRLTRGLMPFLAMVSMVSVAEGLLNHRGHFFWPKVAPAMVSGAMAAAAVFASGKMGIFALVAGVLVGGVLHVAVCLPTLWRLWGALPLAWSHLRTPRFVGFAKEMGKVAAIGVFAQINILVLRTLASLLEQGSVTQYWYANRVVDLAQGAVAVGVSSALLPAVSKAVAAQDWPRFREDFGHGLRLVALVLIPAAGALWLLAEPIVSILFLHGEFDLLARDRTAETLQLLVPFMLAVAGINIVKKAYFALDRRNTLLLVGGVGVAITAVLGWGLSPRFGVAGLAGALSLSTVMQLVLYLSLLRIPGGLGLGGVFGPLVRMGVASVPALGVAVMICRWGHWELGPSWMNLGLFGSATLGAMVVFFGGASLLGIPELDEITEKIKRRLG